MKGEKLYEIYKGRHTHHGVMSGVVVGYNTFMLTSNLIIAASPGTSGGWHEPTQYDVILSMVNNPTGYWYVPRRLFPFKFGY